MDSLIRLTIDLSIILLFLVGVWQFRSPRGALNGNLTAALALALAIGVVSLEGGIGAFWIILPTLLTGSLLGSAAAIRVNMVQIPAMVAFQHGAGGVAAFLVSFVEIVRAGGEAPGVGKFSGLIGLTLGAATFSGSLIAAGKLANRLRQTPTVLPGHGAWVVLSAVLAALIAVLALLDSGVLLAGLLVLLGTVSVAAGILISLRIGGADMPVLISFLNATAGLAAAFCGIVIDNRLLVASGATVAASGSILTLAMCRAMNRSLSSIFRGFQPAAADQAPSPAAPFHKALSEQSGDAPQPSALERAVATFREARRVVFVPGYGMAMAGAQFEVVTLGRLLEERGVTVQYAVHPIAGRMPGHMHVLLAEAEAPYELLREPAEINPEFVSTDLAVVVGASDVVNPAATLLKGTPISGMPILNAGDAKCVLVINLNDSPGYSGVRNLLYDRPATILMWGDAKQRLGELIQVLGEALPELPDTSTGV